jgi:hypothetical protein
MPRREGDTIAATPTGGTDATRREALEMLFHIKQTHAPQDCPYGKGGSRSLFDGESKDVTIHGYWLAFPQHTTYLVVETDDIAHLQTFLRPGAAVTTCEITPVSDQPAPLPT